MLRSFIRVSWQDPRYSQTWENYNPASRSSATNSKSFKHTSHLLKLPALKNEYRYLFYLFVISSAFTKAVLLNISNILKAYHHRELFHFFVVLSKWVGSSCYLQHGKNSCLIVIVWINTSLLMREWQTKLSVSFCQWNTEWRVFTTVWWWDPPAEGVDNSSCQVQTCVQHHEYCQISDTCWEIQFKIELMLHYSWRTVFKQRIFFLDFSEPVESRLFQAMVLRIALVKI